MLCADVTILVNAHRPEAPKHEGYRTWLEEARRGVEPLGVPAMVLSGFLRVVTHPRVFKEPTPVETALEFVEAVRGSPAVIPMEPGDRHWEIFADICRRLDARGITVPDAFLAAIAVEQGATFVSADRSFAGFPGLRWIDPLAA